MQFMKRLSLLVLFAGVLVGSEVYGGVIADWNFNTYGGGAFSSYTADHGSGSSSLAVAGNGTPTFSSISGTTVNAYTGDPAGQALRTLLQGGNTDVQLVLHVTGTGLRDFLVSYATAGNGAPQTWAWSTDGSTYTTLTPTVTAGSSWTTETISFTGVTALNGAADVYFRDTFAPKGATVDFDNFMVTAVPEPITCALPLFGVIFTAGTAARSYLNRRRRSGS